MPCRCRPTRTEAPRQPQYRLEMRRRTVLLWTPPLLLITTTAAFRGLDVLLGSRGGYFAGFLFYWLFWCLTVPVALLGWPRARALLRPTVPVGRQRVAIGLALVL